VSLLISNFDKTHAPLNLTVDRKESEGPGNGKPREYGAQMVPTLEKKRDGGNQLESWQDAEGIED